MKPKTLFSIVSLAGVWLAFNAGPTWAQTVPIPEKSQTEMKATGEGTVEEKMKARETKEPGQTERKKGEEEMEARGAQKPGRMEKGQAQDTEPGQSPDERWAMQDVRKVQEALKNKGHHPGSIDGVIGPQTQQAIRAFQNASGLKETGRLDVETTKKLGIEKVISSERRTSSSKSSPKQKESSLPTGN
jgi:murein L,D-transpeptidase YcbB/YkuD